MCISALKLAACFTNNVKDCLTAHTSLVHVVVVALRRRYVMSQSMRPELCDRFHRKARIEEEADLLKGLILRSIGPE
jgi:hypothetical protein